MKHKPIPKSKRLAVWEKYNHHCAYCGCELEYKDMQVDHIESVYATSIDNDCIHTHQEVQNDDLSNLMPSCRMCNYYKQVNDIEGFRRNLQNMLMRNVRLPFDYRLAVKYGLVVENIHPIKFYFENEAI